VNQTAKFVESLPPQPVKHHVDGGPFLAHEEHAFPPRHKVRNEMVIVCDFPVPVSLDV